MPILQPSYRLESPEIGDSWSDAELVGYKTQWATANIVDSSKDRTKNPELWLSNQVLDKELMQTMDKLIELVQAISIAMDSEDDEKIKNSMYELWHFLTTNPLSIREVFHTFFIFKERYKKILPDRYSRDYSNLVLYWDWFGRAIHPNASESDKSHVYTQAITIPALLRIFRDFHLPKLERAMQSA